MNTLSHRIYRLAWNRHTVSCVILACVSWPLHAATSAVSAGSDHSVALTCEGNVLTWGSNINGQLGDGTLNRRTVPGLVANFNGAVAISAGSEHTLALKSDGTVWSWGRNDNGQLGIGSQSPTGTPRTPVQVSGLANMVAIAAGQDFSAALRSDGTVWTWGGNGRGDLGDNSGTRQTLPVRVTTLPTNIVAIAAGDLHMLALDATGTVWAWGQNSRGEIGDGSSAFTRDLPVVLSSLANITSIGAGAEHSLARQVGGAVFAWGKNSDGQIGDSTQIDRNVPIRVAQLAASVAAAGGSAFSIALKADGTLSAWGYNFFGQLGNGGNATSATPALVSTLSGVSAVSAGDNHVLALRNDGQAWAWGRNDQGPLGAPAVVGSANTPVQVAGVGGAGMLNLDDACRQPGSFYFSGRARGIKRAFTLDGIYRPAAADAGRSINVYLAAIIGGNFYVRGATTWTLWTGDSDLPVFATVTAGSGMSEINVITDLDVSGIPGVPVFMGYGTSQTDMLTNGKFGLIHTFQ
jgi:alpha-tubulin suppressor-like RCC1 family protein